MKLIAVITIVLLYAAKCFAAPSTVLITGSVFNNSGYPIVGAQVQEQLLNPTLVPGSSGVAGTQIVYAETASDGSFTLGPVVGGVVAAIYIPAVNALFRATLPVSGTLTLAQIEAQQPNVVTGFPPGNNLNMGGFALLNTTIGWFNDLLQTKSSRATWSAFYWNQTGGPDAHPDTTGLFGLYQPSVAVTARALSCFAANANSSCTTNPVFELNTGVDQATTACTLVAGTCHASFTGLPVAAAGKIQLDLVIAENTCTPKAAGVNCTVEYTTN